MSSIKEYSRNNAWWLIFDYLVIRHVFSRLIFITNSSFRRPGDPRNHLRYKTYIYKLFEDNSKILKIIEIEIDLENQYLKKKKI